LGFISSLPQLAWDKKALLFVVVETFVEIMGTKQMQVLHLACNPESMLGS
jgi:hypothetical protein